MLNTSTHVYNWRLLPVVRLAMYHLFLVPRCLWVVGGMSIGEEGLINGHDTEDPLSLPFNFASASVDEHHGLLSPHKFTHVREPLLLILILIFSS